MAYYGPETKDKTVNINTEEQTEKSLLYRNSERQELKEDKVKENNFNKEELIFYK